MSSGYESSGQPLGPLDKLFRDTATPILVLFALCCGGVALILSIICIVTAKDPVAKKKAITTLIATIAISVIVSILYAVIIAGGLLAGGAGGN